MAKGRWLDMGMATWRSVALTWENIRVRKEARVGATLHLYE
jgi:hypothetical protein